MALIIALNGSERLADLGVSVGPAEPFGVAVYQRQHVVGIWSFHLGQYRYRSLACWDPIAIVETLDMTLELSFWMAERDAWTGTPALRAKPN